MLNKNGSESFHECSKNEFETLAVSVGCYHIAAHPPAYQGRCVYKGVCLHVTVQPPKASHMMLLN